MIEPNTLFKPITATPNRNSVDYVEIEPCDALKPYIRCFWGTPCLSHASAEKDSSPGVVIPDTCMDIIFTFDYVTNMVSCKFCGINDTSFLTESSTGLKSIFGVRFYFWAVHLFVNRGLNDVCNTITDVERYFPDYKNNLEGVLIHYSRIVDRIPHAEDYLLKKLNDNFHPNNNILNAVFSIVNLKGVVSVPQVCKYSGISKRKLERIFSEYIGVSPKKAADLVRYQCVWRDIFFTISPDYHDIVYQYGYTDQAHLLNNFRKYHGMSPNKALTLANK